MAKAEAAEPAVPSRAELLQFAAPLVAVTTVGPLLSNIDTSFVGRCAGTIELAALGPACTVTDLIGLICSVVSTASLKLSSGVTTEEQRRSLGATCICVALAVGFGGAFVSVALRGFLLGCLSTTQEMMPSAQRYVAIRALGLPPSTLASAFYGLCVGQGDSLTPLVVNVGLSAVLNVLFDWLLCAVVPLGSAGAAFATVVAQFSSFAAYFTIMRWTGRLPLPPLRDFLPTKKQVRTVMGIFLPVAYFVTAVLSMYACMSAFVNSTQTIAISAAYKVVISVFAFVALCADPLAAATTSMLGRMLASPGCRRSSVVTFIRRAVSCALGVGLVSSLLGGAVLRYGASIFTREANVAAGASIALGHVVAILTLFHPTRVFMNVSVAMEDFLFYVVAQTLLSLSFFAALKFLMGFVPLGAAREAYLCMWTAVLIYHIGSIVVFALRSLHLARRQPA